MFLSNSYNYDHFTREVLIKDAKRSGGPDPGEVAPDFTLRTIDGDKLSLSDFEDHKNVMLTFGSATCPMTLGSIGGLNDLCEKYRGDEVEFLFVYVREAHPGEDLPAHGSLQEKVRAAGLGAFRVGRERAANQFNLLIHCRRDAVHRADEGAAPAADHAVTNFSPHNG